VFEEETAVIINRNANHKTKTSRKEKTNISNKQTQTSYLIVADMM
jgi:hypothetical protein